jgi:hypothetical protein
VTLLCFEVLDEYSLKLGLVFVNAFMLRELLMRKSRPLTVVMQSCVLLLPASEELDQGLLKLSFVVVNVGLLLELRRSRFVSFMIGVSS